MWILYWLYHYNGGVDLRKVTEKALELLQAGSHSTRVLHEQGIEVDHGVVGEL